VGARVLFLYLFFASLVCVACAAVAHSMAALAGGALEASAGTKPVPGGFCTFALSESNYLLASYYLCRDCDAEGNCAFCKSCAMICHQGHDVVCLTMAGKAYCDCQQHDCQILQQSKVTCSENQIVPARFRNMYSERKPLTRLDDSALPVRFFKELHQFNYSNISRSPSPPSTSEAAADSDSLVSSAELIVDQCQALVALSKDTFWVGHNDTPRCLLEKFALEIFAFHVHRLGLEVDEHSGAEYWCQVKDLSVDKTCDEDTSTAVGIDMHYDKDEFLAGASELGIFPDLSTVTYMTNNNISVPTIVMDCDIEQEVETPIDRSLLIFPKQGHHLSFSGTALHGAPGMLRQETPQAVASSSFRVTFLVNVWLRHKPIFCHKLPSQILSNILQSALPAQAQATTMLANAETLVSIKSTGNREDVSHGDKDSMSLVGQSSVIEGRLTSALECIHVGVKSEGYWMSIPVCPKDGGVEEGEDEVHGLSLRLFLPNEMYEFVQSGQNNAFLIEYDEIDMAALLIDGGEWEEENEEEDVETDDCTENMTAL
jgi:hypothetical protein